MKRAITTIVSLLIFACTFAQSEDPTWEELFEKGKYYREHANSFRALEYLEKAESKHSSDTIRRELASTYYARGKYQKCIDFCRSVLYPDTLDSDLYLMARSFEKMEKLDSAITYQYMVADRNIENYNNLVSLCNTLINTDAIDDAIILLDAYCAIDSTNSAINTVKGFALHKAGRYKDAIEVYKKLKLEGDDRSSTNYYLGLSYYLAKKTSNNVFLAYEFLRRATEQTQRKNPSILVRFAITALAINFASLPFGKDDFDRSELAIVKDSYLRKIFYNLDTDYKSRQEQIDIINAQGKSDIDEAIELMQPNKDMLFYVYNHCGNKMAEAFNPAEAIYFYNKAKSVYSNRFNLYYQMAIQYHRLKDYRNEMKSFEQYIKYAPSDEDPDTIEYAKECIAECKKVLFMKEK